jgi:hypothetical protein
MCLAEEFDDLLLPLAQTQVSLYRQVWAREPSSSHEVGIRTCHADALAAQ